MPGATDITSAFDLIEKTKEFMTSVTETVNTLNQHMSTMMEAFSGVAGKIAEVGAKIGDVGAKAAAGIEQLKGFGSAFTDLWDRARKQDWNKLNVEPLTLALGGLAGSMAPVTVAMTKIGEEATKSTTSFQGTAEYLGKLASMFPVLGSALKALGVGWVKHFEAVRDAENGLRRMLAVSGDLNAVFGDSGKVTIGLGAALQDYQQHLYDVATATDEGIDKVAEYYAKLGTITGAYSQVIERSPEQNITLMEGAMKIATGTGHDFSEVFKVMESQFERFNIVGKQPLDLFAQMHYSAQQLGIRLEYLTANVEHISKSFQTYGDNTAGALKLTESFYAAFKGVEGLGPEVLQNIIQGITTAMKEMGLAEKAFLSGQTGGAGGLRGAYEIELKLREGGVDEVYRMMEDALKKQFGGKIATLEEAAGSDTAAAELTRQVAFLTQGPFGAVVKSTPEAIRLLEGFRRGIAPGTEAPEGEAFDKAMDESENIQRLHTTILTGIQNEATMLNFKFGKLAVEQGRRLVGIGGGGTGHDEGLLASARDAQQTRLREAKLTDERRDVRVGKTPTIGVSEALQGASAEFIRLTQTYGDNIAQVSQELLPKISKMYQVPLDALQENFERYQSGQQAAGEKASVGEFLASTLKHVWTTGSLPQMADARRATRGEGRPAAPRGVPGEEGAAVFGHPIPPPGATVPTREEHNHHINIHVTFDPEKSSSQNFVVDTGTAGPQTVNATKPSSVSTR